MTGAKAARLWAGLTLEEAARRLRWTPGYLRQIERVGAPWTAAVRLAALYEAPVEAFRQVDDSWTGSQETGPGRTATGPDPETGKPMASTGEMREDGDTHDAVY